MGKGWIWRMPILSLLLLLILPPWFSLADNTEPQYLILVPSEIRTKTSENVCVQMIHLNETVTLSITLEFEDKNISLAEVEMAAGKDIFQCVSFQLPKLTRSSSNSPSSFTRYYNSRGLHMDLLRVVLKGQTLNIVQHELVTIRNPSDLLFVQTDKPIYKPGQEVKIRIVCLQEDFRPINKKIPLIYIQDPRNNRVFQWNDVQLSMGLTQLAFPLSSEPALGTYKLMVEKSSTDITRHPFSVEEYVLPKFEVSVKAPKQISVLATKFEVTVCGRYTYGKPVPGLVNMTICRRYQQYNPCPERDMRLCEEYTGEANGQGCFSQVVEAKMFHLKQNDLEDSITAEGKITEEGTGVEMTSESIISITSTVSKLSFENAEPYYKPGIPLFLQMKLVDGMDVPMANKSIEVTGPSVEYTARYTTNEEGRIQFSIDTSNFTEESINLQAVYKENESCEHSVPIYHQRDSHTVNRFYSPSQSYLHIDPLPKTFSCGSTEQIRVHFILDPNAAKKEIIFYYLVMTKGDIKRSGTHTQPIQGKEPKGDFLLDLLVDVDTAPITRLFLYTILPSGELVAHSRDFTVEKCFSNKARLWFSDQQGLPGQKIQLHLAASPGSLCAFHAVDQSIFLLKPAAELSHEKIYALLPVSSSHELHFENERKPCIKMENIEVGGIRYRPIPFSHEEADVSKILKGLGLKVFTSAKILKPNICDAYPTVTYGYPRYHYGMPAALIDESIDHFGLGILLGLPDSEDEMMPAETVRMEFPETWLWDLVIIEDSKPTSVPVTIPDTITEWKAGAFCLSADVGFGLAQPTYLKAFQPFFIELTMPYSVVRGETFPLKATVFSYQTHNIRVKISLAPSADFEAISLNKEEESYCIGANGRITVSWTVSLTSLGEVNFTASAEALNSDQLCGNEVVEMPSIKQKDVVIKTLLVEPEGIEKEVVFNSVICTQGDALSEPLSLKVPENVVEGSARATFCVLGDILGGAIKNLNQLLKMPYGCGEQNMALFAPNIYILNYLNQTGQLTEEIKSKAIGYLVTGYQRQLNYKHQDGSYSTFGEWSSEIGNTWLTAFVLKSFTQAASFISMDQKHIIDAQNLLAIRQLADGSFLKMGSLLNNALKGGVDDSVSLTAYITIALLEMPLPRTNFLVQNALRFLETEAQKEEIHVYLRALMAYAFTLAENEEKRQEMLDSLQKLAVKEEDGSIHWERPEKQKKTLDLPYYHPRAPSAEVEMTSYVLLAYVAKKPSPSQEELTTATTIVKWLTNQQNPNGGFSSTQDTVVALQALCQYKTITYSKDGAGARVTLSSGDVALRKFHVDSTNSLLLQCQDLPSVPGDYTAEVTGCVFMQTSLRYNIQPLREDAPFNLLVQTVPQNCTGPKAHQTFDIAINVSYTGQRVVSNMAIVQIKMLSGYIPVKFTVKSLEYHPAIKRTEIATTQVLLYLEEVSNITQSFSFRVEMETPVQGLKPALVKVYDYYETDDFAISEYIAPCSTDEDVKKH
ncbi:alpha-2-macroglobulin-like [Thamnophis elegans]|uniref:alpha-2-macroglobulin-like n=1 Tax=Thamnophis elegans TaxID=35005 RepID=UPI0013784B27|nr:alpha-2-macroglobulin-like [Thamnophis elegans]